MPAALLAQPGSGWNRQLGSHVWTSDFIENWVLQLSSHGMPQLAWSSLQNGSLRHSSLVIWLLTWLLASPGAQKRKLPGLLKSSLKLAEWYFLHILLVKVGHEASPDATREVYKGMKTRRHDSLEATQVRVYHKSSSQFNSIFHNFIQLRGIKSIDVSTLGHRTCLPHSTSTFSECWQNAIVSQATH